MNSDCDVFNKFNENIKKILMSPTSNKYIVVKTYLENIIKRDPFYFITKFAKIFCSYFIIDIFRSEQDLIFSYCSTYGKFNNCIICGNFSLHDQIYRNIPPLYYLINSSLILKYGIII